MTVRALFDRTNIGHGSRSLDAAVASALLTTDAVGSVVWLARHSISVGQAIALGALALATATAFVQWRRHRPLQLALGVVVGSALGNAIVAHGLLSQRTALQVALVAYALGSWCNRRRAALVVVVAASILAAAAGGHARGNWRAAAASAIAVVLAPWLAGATARLRRVHVADLEDRLARADAERDARAERAVRDERARIARELHDVVAHHVSLIGVQAGAARTTLGRNEDGTREALSGIEATSRDAVREMRRLVDVLDPGDGASLIAPPRRADLEALCAGFEAAGLSVDARLGPVVDDLPPALALTAFRIVEEALTNITRHSQARGCTVELAQVGGRLRIVVDDPGPSHQRAPVPPPGAGRGLTGMRERVALFGGQLVVGSIGRGFRVEATLPVPAS